jgi:hypothetical protein
VLFNEKPSVFRGSLFLELHQRELAAKLLSLEEESDVAVGHSFSQGLFAIGSARGRSFNVSSLVPDHDGARAVVPFGNGSLETAVLDWVIFDLDGEPWIGRGKGGALRYGPTFQRSVQLQAEIVVSSGRRVLLHDEA